MDNFFYALIIYANLGAQAGPVTITSSIVGEFENKPMCLDAASKQESINAPSFAGTWGLCVPSRVKGGTADRTTK